MLKDATTGAAVGRRDLVKGFAAVLFAPEELDALKVESTEIIDIERFVDGAAIASIGMSCVTCKGTGRVLASL